MRRFIPFALIVFVASCTDDSSSVPADSDDIAVDGGDGSADAPDGGDTTEAGDAVTDSDGSGDLDADVDSDAADAVEIPEAIPGEPVVIEDDAETREFGLDGPCGTPVELVGRGLRRAPYVQSVFTDNARIAWTDTFGASGSVRYSTVGSGEWRTVEAEVEAWPIERTHDTEAYNDYDATLLGLEPDTDVCYEVYVDGALLVARGSFHTAWTSHDKPISILAMGDSGNASAEQFAIRDRMVEADGDVFLHLGDMAYGDGTFPEFEERVFDVYEGLMAAIPSWPTPGNHEYKTGFADGYIGVYHLPEQAWRAEDQEYYYSFDYGNVHFVSIDSNEYRYVTTIGNTGDDMLDWLEDDLANADADWVIAFMHHPPYSSGQHGSTRWLQEVVVPMLEAHGADLVLAGHDHHYERTYELWDDAIEEDSLRGITYIVAGAGGAGTREVAGDWFTASANDEVHNFLELVIDGCTGTGTAIDLEGNTVDSFVLDGCND